jgi:hypothetical protein
MHANAHARATFIFRDCLGIVPSSGIDRNFRHALAEMPFTGIQTRAALAAAQSSIVKVD